MYIQPCLIKKNTSKLRKTLEKFGYKRAKLTSIDPNYDNDKEPWIICAYDIYVCVDKEAFEDMKSELLGNEFLANIPELSKEFIDCKKDEKLFLENACKELDIAFE